MEEKEQKVDLGTKDPDVMNSKNKMQQDDQDKATNAEEGTNIEDKNFTYLIPRDNESPSVFGPSQKKSDENNEVAEDENIFKKSDSDYKYVICILLKEDNEQDSKLLKKTLDSIKSNFGELGELGINYENILIYIFVSKIKKEVLVTKEDITNNLSGENKLKYYYQLLNFLLFGNKNISRLQLHSCNSFLKLLLF